MIDAMQRVTTCWSTASTGGANGPSEPTEMGKTLVYERTGDGDKYLPLIISPENAKAVVGGSVEAPFVIANSMREVQPEINLLVSPMPDGCSLVLQTAHPPGPFPVGDD
jgi:hypothetical protein